MTNQLFRDYLDGKIHVRRPFKAGRIYTAPVGHFLSTKDSTGWTELDAASPDGYMHTSDGDITPWLSPKRTILDYHAYYETKTPMTPELRALIYGDMCGASIDRIIYDETSPRARALRAKEERGHGPKAEPLRVRGRNNRYKEKS